MLAQLHGLAVAGSPINSTDNFFVLDADVPWQGTLTRSARFEGGYGEASETLWLPALGSLLGSTAQLFVGTEASFGGFCPGGTCAPIRSSLRIISADTGALLSNPTVFLSPTGVSVKDYPSAVIDFMPSWQGTITGAAGSGWQIGPAPLLQKLRLEHSYEVPSGWMDLHAGPTLALSLDLHVSQTYQPFSTATYLDHGIEAATTAGASTDLARAAGAAGYVRTLRGTSGATSAFNTELRDAEYALYGYGAGLALRQFKALDFRPGSKGDPALDGFIESPFIQSPAGAAAWYFAKEVARNNAALGKVWSLIFSAPPGQTNNLPGTTDLMGGIASNTRGFLHGLRGGSVESLDDCLSSVFCVGVDLRAANAPSLRDAGAPSVMPAFSQDVPVTGGTARLSVYDLETMSQASIDLPGADAHLFVFLAGSVESIDFGGGLSGSVLVQSGDAIQTFALQSGHFSFVDSTGVAASSFMFLPEASQVGTGPLSFGFGAHDTPVSFVVTSVTSAVPEPSTGALLAAAGVLRLVLGRRRQRTRAAD